MPAAPPELVFCGRVNLWIVLVLAGLLGSLLAGVLLALAGDEREAGMAFAVSLLRERVGLTPHGDEFLGAGHRSSHPD